MALDADDLDMFLDPDMPGYVTTVTWTPKSGPGGTFVARFKAITEGILSGMVTANEPALIFVTSDAEVMTNGDAVKVDDVDYTVRDVIPFCDGKMTRAMLRAAA